MKSATTIDFTDFSLKMKLQVWTEKSQSCWEWAGSITSSGYGQFKFRGEVHVAHRVAWAIENQKDPSGSLVDHMCHNTKCVNPAHLRLASHKQNMEHLLPVRAGSGYRGVHKHGSKWRAVVRHNGTMHRSQSCATAEEANAIAVSMRNEMYSHNLLDRIPA